MNKAKDLEIFEKRPRGLTRREAARQLLGCMASGTLVWASGSHPIWKHLADEDLMGTAESDVVTVKLQFLNGPQFESLVRLSEAIVPGASKAKAPEFIDLLLSVDTAKHQREFADSLSALETESTKKYGKKLVAIASGDLSQLLTDASSSPKADKSAESLRGAFEDLKEWISGAYYSSEMGMKELGWTPDRVFSEFPGCEHSENHS